MQHRMQHQSQHSRSSTTPPIHTFLPYMHDVARYQRSLHDLALTWRLIEATTRIGVGREADCILPTIQGARHHFDELEEKLIRSLVEEKLSGVLRELRAKALYIVDLVVRNLYERTADVAFLATDPVLCAYMENPETPETEDELIRERLRAYQRKYTVYDGIALLTPDGTVRVGVSTLGRLPARCDDKFVEQALQEDGYVEVFAHNCLQPWKRESLIYCHRIIGPESGAPVGALCLCFDLEDEMRGIFASHRDPSERYNMLLLAGDDRCIASADTAWIPPGVTVPTNDEGDSQLKMHAGRLYLVSTCKATGYQGYPGPKGWRGQVMIPLDTAFSVFRQLPSTGTARRLQHASEVCPPLQDITTAAQTIRRVVWNGQVISGSLGAHLSDGNGSAGTLLDHEAVAHLEQKEIRLQAVLDQISDTGARSDDMFQHAIRELYDTVLGFNMQDAEFVTRLMVDLLDRNLYERANDCRWWALSPALRDALCSRNPAVVERARQTLQHINSLYTVYTSIVLYDRDGMVVAASRRDPGQKLPDSPVDTGTVMAVSRLNGEEAYTVEGFAPHPYYDGRPTYVYHAAIRTDDASRITMGGIGLVFDSAIELPAMLEEALAGKPHCHACYADRNGRIIAASGNSRLSPGDTLPFELPPEFLQVGRGESACRLIEHHDELFITACCASDGYREFKRTDGYRDEVIAIMWQNLGKVDSASSFETVALNAAAASNGGNPYAIFVCAGRLYAVDAAKVQEARSAEAMLPVKLGASTDCVGMIAVTTDMGQALACVFDLAAWLGEPSASSAEKQVIVLNDGGVRVGLLVDQLHSVGRHVSRPLHRGLDDEVMIQEVIQFASELVPVLDTHALMRKRSPVAA